MNKIKSQAENRQFSNPDEADAEESRSSLVGKLHACEDVITVLDKLLGAGFFRSPN